MPLSKISVNFLRGNPNLFEQVASLNSFSQIANSLVFYRGLCNLIDEHRKSKIVQAKKVVRSDCFTLDNGHNWSYEICNLNESASHNDCSEPPQEKSHHTFSTSHSLVVVDGLIHGSSSNQELLNNPQSLSFVESEHPLALIVDSFFSYRTC